MTPGSDEHEKFMGSVIPAIKNIRDRALAKYSEGEEKSVADGWFIATLFSLAITIGKKGGLNDTQLRAVFEMYLSTINEHPHMPVNPATVIHKG
jgi:hypothetical protein